LPGLIASQGRRQGGGAGETGRNPNHARIEVLRARWLESQTFDPSI
jgi:hypothetical protein